MRRKKDSLGLFQALLFGAMFYIVIGLQPSPMGSTSALAQNTALPFRPIGSESAVDRYNNSGMTNRSARDRETATNRHHRESATSRQLPENATDRRRRETGFYRPRQRAHSETHIRQVAMQSGGFSLPSGEGAAPNGASPPQPNMPPLNTPPQLLPGQSRPPAQAPPQSSGPLPPTPNLQPAPPSPPPQLSTPPRTLPNSMAPGPPNSATPQADYQPLAPPRLSNGGFATTADCRLVTPPSNYTAMSPYGGGCGGVAPTGYAAPSPDVPPPAQIPAPATMPPYAAPAGTAAVGAAAPVGSLMTFGQETYPVQVGQGLWGQPVAYVPGQRFRNWLRYFSF